jgi:hypothetical protein
MKEGVCLKKAVTAFACPDGGHPYVQSGLDQIPVGSPFQEIQFPTFNLNKFISTKVNLRSSALFVQGITRIRRKLLLLWFILFYHKKR